MKCPKCGSRNIIKKGKDYPLGSQRYKCKDCGKRTVENKLLHSANVAVLDIETAPVKAFVWRTWKENILPHQIISDWFCLSWSVKWLNEPDCYSKVLTPAEAIKQDDSRIMKDLWHFLEDADVVIAHNGKKFDIPCINTRFLVNDIHPPMPYFQIDTLEVCKKNFRFSHNKLDYINAVLGIEQKHKTDFELWIRCYSGQIDALQEMEKYNRQDVYILEELYWKIRPYIKSHPNMGLFVNAESDVCPACGSNKLTWGGSYITPLNKYTSFRCESCGSIGRSRESELTKLHRAKLTRSVAR